MTRCWRLGGAASPPWRSARTSTSSSAASACRGWASTGIPAREPIGSEELAASMAPFMSYCIEQFGPDRCMFESNFPVDKVSFSHHVLFNAFKRFSKLLGLRARGAVS